MKKKAAYKHLDKLWKKMQKHFKKFTRTEDSNELHQFRVQAKKIRSFLTLLETDEKNKQLLKEFKPVKKIFKTAGIIRDASLHVKQAKEHKIKLPEFYEEQDKIQKEETQKLVSKKKKHIKKMKAVKKKIKKDLQPVSPDEIKIFFTSQLDNTYRLLKKHDFSEQLHNGRKMLKHLMYNEDAVHDGVEKELHINFTYIDKLQDVLGQWHDHKLMLDFFSDKKLGNKDIDSMKAKNGELEKSIAEIAKGFKQKISANGHSHTEG
jgi:CHAD domain-containing protein